MIPDDPRAHLLDFLASLQPKRPAGPDALTELDSLDLLKVVMYLEETYGINLADHQVEPDDLRSLEGLLSIVQRCAP
jgi:hypothetical protein